MRTIHRLLILLPIFAFLALSCNQNKVVPPTAENDTVQGIDTSHQGTDTSQMNHAEQVVKKEPTPPKELLKKIKKKEVAVLLHCTFTEPFIDIYITDSEMLVTDMGETRNESFLLKNSFNSSLKKQVINYVDKVGQPGSLTILKEPGNDGMSDTEYPYKAKWMDHEGCAYENRAQLKVLSY